MMIFGIILLMTALALYCWEFYYIEYNYKDINAMCSVTDKWCEWRLFGGLVLAVLGAIVVGLASRLN